MLSLCAGDVVRCNFTANTARTTGTTGHGGAIVAADNATLSMQGSFLQGNSASAYAGGLHLWMHARAKVWNTAFTSNTALEQGGAVYTGSGAGLLLKDCKLRLNSAFRGGALLAANDSIINVWRSSFVANNATEDGGAVYLWGNVTARFDAVVFANNTARYGGAIDVEDNVTLHLLASKLSHNAAQAGGAAVYAGGNSSVQLERCNLTGNSASFGAGMCMFGSSITLMINTVFASNSAQYSGGGLYIAQTARVRVLQTQFLKNTGPQGGAVRLIHNSSAELSASLLQDNAATIGGAAVFLGDYCTLRCTQVRFLHNTAASSGGAIAAMENATFSVLHCTFESNQALISGGALYLGEIAAKGTVFEVSAVNNTADKGGFAAVIDAAVLNVANGTFVHNSAGRDGRGGVVFAARRAVVNLMNCEVSGFAQGLGVYGGAFNIDDNVRLTLSACTIADYSAERGGGLAANGNSSVHVQNCIWRNLTADRFGGGAQLQGKAHMSLRGGKFIDTHAEYGGAISTIMSGSLDMADVVFENATATVGGGAIHAEQDAAAKLADCHFNSCSADGSGGALYANNNVRVKLVGCNMTRCTTKGLGGAVVVVGNATVDIDRCILQKNRAKTYCGAVGLGEAGHMLAKHSSFVNNTCAQKGGGLAADSMSQLHLEHCIVASNGAERGGGLYLADNATLRLDNLTRVVDNVATVSGGGVVVVSNKFSLSALRAAVRNNKAPVDADISASPTGLAMYSSSAVNGFVSRMRSDEGLWDAKLLVTGPQALPSSGVIVAKMDGAQLTRNKSGKDGLVDLHIKLRKPPGKLGTWPTHLILTCSCSVCSRVAN
jgi:predicted outer membrane repeat protein